MIFLTIDAKFRWGQKKGRSCNNTVGPLSDLETVKSNCIKDGNCKAIALRGTAKRVGDCTGLDDEIKNCVNGKFVVPGTCDLTHILGVCEEKDLRDSEPNCILEKGILLECIYVFNSENGYIIMFAIMKFVI